jgi:type IV pilus assembly protein PilA
MSQNSASNSVRQDSRHDSHPKGFTIVELLIVIVVIGILAAITIVAYNGISNRARNSSIQSDLHNAASAMEVAKTTSSTVTYPTSLPSNVTASGADVLQLATTGGPDTFCINAYGSNGLTSSYNSSTGSIRSYLCDGAGIGSPIGGSVPTAPRGVNLDPGFSAWTLTGGATFDGTTLTLGASGVATSPLIRVDSPSGIAVGADYYATTASPSSSYAPQGSYHTGISYYGADGTTAATNSTNYTSNGCALGLNLNAWLLADTRCTYNGGPNVIYTRWSLFGSNGGYASPDLKVKNAILKVN